MRFDFFLLDEKKTNLVLTDFTIEMRCLHPRIPNFRKSFKIINFHSLLTKKPYGFHRFSSKSHFLPFITTTNEPSPQILHAKLVKNGTLHGLNVGNYVLSLYIKCQYLKHAFKLFDEMPDRDVRTWTIVISGCARLGFSEMGLRVFKDMCRNGGVPNGFTLSSVLKCCSSFGEVKLGKELHGWIIVNGVGLDVVLSNSILDVYVKCGDVESAERLFRTMVDRDTVSWNIIIGAFLEVGDVKSALDLFGIMPFKDVASWNTMIDGMVKNGFEGYALELLHKMVETESIFNEVTFSIALALVSSLFNLEIGRQIHCKIIRADLQGNHLVRSSLMDMYSKCEELEKTTMIFTKALNSSKKPYDCLIPQDTSWSSMISGFTRNSKYGDAFRTFKTMVRGHTEMDKFTLTSIVSACANVGILELGQQLHAYIQKIGHKIDVHLSSTLIDMYSKCGSLKDAQMIFKEADNRNIVTWTSMIIGCALHGQARVSFELFECMVSEGVVPNKVTFLGLLTACTHAGLPKEGYGYFKLMKEVYRIKPAVEHFNSMVDLYGRAGLLNKAKEFIYENGITHLTAVWKSLLSSCRVHKNIELGKWVSERIIQLEPNDPGLYVLLSNMCATDHKWDEVSNVRNLMQQRGIKKYPGQSWIKVNNQVHTFVMGDTSHPQQTEIYSYLDKLIGRLKEIGYSPDFKLVMQDVEEEQGEVFLSCHSEKLAIAYGIMNTSPGVPIRIMKNLRVCVDCHNFTKYTSQLLGVEIILRDIHRFHHFKSGHCSCRDFW